MTSRLDRLFILLESGSSSVTRRAAAKQIGEVQKMHPHELHNLLNRLLVYLQSGNWDTRIAAAQAVESILNNVPPWDPQPSIIKNEKFNNSSQTEESHLSFSNFDLEKVLDKGALLMGSEGTEFDVQDDTEEDNKERLIKQRALLNDKLGLSKNNSLGVTFDDIVTLDDMKVEQRIETQRLIPVQDILNLECCTNLQDSISSQSLSCREKNRAKRMARQSNSVGGNSNCPLNRSTSSIDIEPEKKKIKTELSRIDDTNMSSTEPVPDPTGNWGDAIDWPLESFCSKLYIDMFSPRWETRHGSATALRELLKSHCDGAGKCIWMTKDEMDYHHKLWLEDAVLRLLCVLSLDRFGDFLSDQVVAPVRETCAQVLGAILKQMPSDKVEKTIDVLLLLIKQKDWEVRHGGLLGIKYLLVVREDLMQTFLPIMINPILSGLLDHVDDVGAVAAATLIPIASWLPKLLTSEEVSNIVKMLWDLLLDQDELTSACNSFMGLLAAILSLPDAAKWIQMEPMAKLIPRLWPFLSHSTSSVRKSTLQTLNTLTQTPSNNNLNISTDTSTEGTASLKYNFGVKDWPTELLQDAFRHVYQRVLIEHIEDIQNLAVEVWNNIVINAELSALLHASCPLIATWLCLAMQPARLAFDPASIVCSKVPQRKFRSSDMDSNISGALHKVYLGGTETTPLDLREKNVTKARCKASQMLGLLSKYIVMPDPGIIDTAEIESPIDRYTVVLIGYLNSRSALQRLISSMVIAHWAIYDIKIQPGPLELQKKLTACQTEYIYYDEVGVSFTSLLQKSYDFLATLKQYKIPIPELENCKALSIEQIHLLSTTLTENLKTTYSLKPKISELIDDRRKNLQNSFASTSHEQNFLNISVQAALAGASICLHSLPEKLNPVIKPIMESIKREECEVLQQLSAKYLVHLLDQIRTRNPCPINKIITNLCRLLRSDSEFTPKILFTDDVLKDFEGTNTSNSNPFHGIISLTNRQRTNESQNKTITRGPGRPPIADIIDEAEEIEDPFRKQNQIQRIGATFAITAICTYFGSDLKLKLPIIWELMTDHIDKNFNLEKISALQNEKINQDETISLITSLQLIEIAVPHIHKYLEDDILVLLPKLGILLRHPFKAIRHLTSRCLATISAINTSKIMDFVMEIVVPLLSTIENVIHRQGAVETISCIVNKLQFKIVPYVVLLVVPLLGRMSDPSQSVRLMSTQCFAKLIQLMPLDGNTPDLPELSQELQAQKVKDKKFLDYLFLPKTIPDFKIQFPINAELRNYQQAGVNWLWFLNKYKLHGILCDDMGLGKTLQTICILAGDHYQRNIENLKPLPSLVICPPTLTGHWVYEVNKFLPNKFMKPLRYVGLPIDRERLRQKISSYNLVIASYDIVRKDINYFGSTNWNYCVLDEGHIIKNGKTKSSIAIKKIIANHRLILSGTPIQNNVLELWSLFDFLMPGFLGTEKQFMTRFSRPILASRDAKSSPKEQEAGALAMEGLHRQVLPFLLRRVKEDVLTDLPPKITQDLLCELSPIQERLYEDLSKKQINSEIRNCIENLETQNLNKKTHVFQALRYLQNVCNHPKLVLNLHHPEYKKIQIDLSKENSTLDDIEHSGKLPALKQLLLDCGIGIDDFSVNQHRALIFCQLKAMLDIVEHDLLKKHLPAVSYLRLDGSVPTSARHDIVTKFNGDPSIDVLLLTTQVGGLGLNLTGADTVIFVEHDWNPMKDLQAMDRAHRIGQKKVVNVYRLITRKSLEEKIMGLQKFKLLTANTIVTDENSSMETMGTPQLLDLFDLTENQNNAKTSNQSGGSTIKQVLENLPELWDDKQYEEEYDLSQFLQKLK